MKAIVLNLLSVGAAYGVLVLVFQEGVGDSLLGFKATGVIDFWSRRATDARMRDVSLLFSLA